MVLRVRVLPKDKCLLNDSNVQSYQVMVSDLLPLLSQLLGFQREIEFKDNKDCGLFNSSKIFPQWKTICQKLRQVNGGQKQCDS